MLPEFSRFLLLVEAGAWATCARNYFHLNAEMRPLVAAEKFALIAYRSWRPVGVQSKGQQEKQSWNQ